MKPVTQTRKLTVAAVMGLFVLLSGCGKQAFVVTSTTTQQKAPGTFTIPARVDILLAEDDTGSIYEIYPSIAQQMPVFLNGLESSGWDYHFATIPLTTTRAISQVVGSKYDSNWGAAWVAPYPGATSNGPGTIMASAFATFSSYSGFLSYYDITNFSNGQEAGFEKIKQALYTGSSGTGFLRPDALLVILAVGNGNDTSGVTYCNRGDGFYAPAEVTPSTGPCTKDGQTVAYAQTSQSSFNSYVSQFQTIRPSPSLVKFYAAVANQTSCLGGSAYIGTRYQQMATTLGGKQYNICSQSVSSVLSDLSSQLQATKLGFVQKYAPIGFEPNPSTIVVTKYVGGDPNNTVTIPQNATNGWTYAGNLTDAYMIEWPTPMNKFSGYAVELHGTAKAVGEDSISVKAMPAGVQNSSSN